MPMSSFPQSLLFSAEGVDSPQRMLQVQDNEVGTQDSLELVAILVWYIFLVICCVVPTFCAYRRRRLLEQQFALERANLHRLQQSSNLLMLSNLQQSSEISRRNSERVQQERHRALTDELKGTTMVINAEHIETESSPLPSVPNARASEDASSVDEGDDGAVSAIESGAAPDNNDIVATALDQEIDYADFTEDYRSVRLPPDAVNADRIVPGVCAICLGSYEEGDEVSWSPKANCQHAFHTDCIIPWLAKKDEPKCPVCRQEFCSTAVVDQATTELDLEREASLLLSQIYRPYPPSESGNRDMSVINLELTNLAIRNRTANAALEAGLHTTHASPSEGGAEAPSSFTTLTYTRGRPRSEIDQGTDDVVANADTNGTTRTIR